MFGRHPTRWLAPYAEGLLSGSHASQIAGHVLCCPRCRRALDEVRAGQALARRLGPADAAPSWSDLAPLLDAPARPTPTLRWAFAFAAALAVVVGGLAWRGFGALEARAAAPLELAALEAHRTDAPELRTSDAGVAQRWLADRGFDLSPPRSSPHRQLEGAARLPGGAVSLSYRLGGEPVTLVVAAAAATVERKRITHRSEGALEVASWTHGGRAYALVSRLRGGAVCTVCHAPEGPAAVL